MDNQIVPAGLALRTVKGRVFLRNIDLHATAEKYKTPLFLYDLDCIKQKISGVKRNLGGDIKLYYAVKANPNIRILENIFPLVDGVDISSGGELRQVLKAGFSPAQISFAGPGKTDEELTAAVAQEIGSISVESVRELMRIDTICAGLEKKANVSLRINPSKLHKKFPVKMGGKPTQFGMDEEEYGDFFSCLKTTAHCNYAGLHVFSGTQCLDEETLLENIAYILQLSRKIFENTLLKPRFINFGGGFGVPYHEGQKEIDIARVSSSIAGLFDKLKQETGLSRMKGILELGRYIIAEAGIYIAQVLEVKKSKGKKFCILNGGMNHHLAASGKFGQLIRQNFKMINISRMDAAKGEPVSIVGPLCTSLDHLGEEVEISGLNIGDYAGILNSGAYVYTASPLLFLSHSTPAEILIDGDRVEIIRRSFGPEHFD